MAAIFIVATSCIFLNGLQAFAQTANPLPKLPYEDWGACPFECCTYREWTANAETGLRAEPRTSARELFRVQKDEKVQGLTGVVVTQEPGLIKATKNLSLDEENPVRVRSGEQLYVLHYQGEGYWAFWFKGRIHSAELPGDEEDTEDGLRYMSKPKSVWWVKVKNARGDIGWTDANEHFDHIDACE